MGEENHLYTPEECKSLYSTAYMAWEAAYHEAFAATKKAGGEGVATGATGSGVRAGDVTHCGVATGRRGAMGAAAMPPLTTALMETLREEAVAAEQVEMDERHDGDFTVCTLATLRSVVGAVRGMTDLKAVPVGAAVDEAATGDMMVCVMCDDPGFLFA